MSNSAVGHVYEQIIDDVISSARVDFEESGIDEMTLEDLRKGWQEKLTQLGVAEFSWDPKPVEPPAPPPATEPIFAPMPNQMPLPQVNDGHLPLPGNSFIKPDPDAPGPELTGNFQNVAAARAAQQLHSNYGARATNSINAIRSGGSQEGGLLLPHPSQTDGAADADAEEESLKAVVVHMQADGSMAELGRVEIDRLIHNQIAANARLMEGGGLMVPLKKARRNIKVTRTERSLPAGQVDGADDDDEDDEDAINSDLDDPDDPDGESEDDDDPLGPMMLCMYDKVQRVKNKWKCVLKDGVLTVNGKDYVFHKANGEYEW